MTTSGARTSFSGVPGGRGRRYATLRVVTAVYGDHASAWRASRRSGTPSSQAQRVQRARRCRLCAALDGARGHANPALRSSRRAVARRRPWCAATPGRPADPRRRYRGRPRLHLLSTPRRELRPRSSLFGCARTTAQNRPLRITSQLRRRRRRALTDLGLIPQWVSSRASISTISGPGDSSQARCGNRYRDEPPPRSCYSAPGGSRRRCCSKRRAGGTSALPSRSRRASCGTRVAPDAGRSAPHSGSDSQRRSDGRLGLSRSIRSSRRTSTRSRSSGRSTVGGVRLRRRRRRVPPHAHRSLRLACRDRTTDHRRRDLCAR